jgi:hypothetical protein
MSDFKIDNIGKLQDFSNLIHDLIAYWFTPDSAGGCRALPDVLVPDPNTLSPNMGQLTKTGDFSAFYDAVDLYRSYDDSRRGVVGDPGQFSSAPASSSLAAFVDGLNHLEATALAIYQNYDAARQDDKLSVDQITAQLNAPSAPSASVPAG